MKKSAFSRTQDYKSNFRPQEHTLSGGDERTFMKLIVDRKTDRVVGCHVMRGDAPNLGPCRCVAMRRERSNGSRRCSFTVSSATLADLCQAETVLGGRKF